MFFILIMDEFASSPRILTPYVVTLLNPSTQNIPCSKEKVVISFDSEIHFEVHIIEKICRLYLYDKNQLKYELVSLSQF